MDLKSYYHETTNGPYLELNEDQIIADLPNNLFAVIDGFGGVGIGDKASQIVCESLQNLYVRVGRDEDATLPFYYSEQGLLESNALINSFFFAQNELKNSFDGKDLSTRGGASALAAVVSDNVFTMVSVGNCMGFLIRNGKVVVTSTPDIIDANYDARDKFFRTVPLNALGLYGDFKYVVNEVKIRTGDLFVLMTDGCYSRLDRTDFKSVFLNPDYMLNEMGEQILSRANQQGNLDNQSIILLQY